MAAKKIVLWAADILCKVSPTAPQSDPSITDDGESVVRSNPVWDSSSGEVRLFAGRNEIVGFQLQIEAPPRSSGPVEATDLAGPSRIEASQVRAYRQWYHFFKDHWYDHALIPLDGANPGERLAELTRMNRVKGQRRQGFWIEIAVPKDARPGIYRGRIQAQVRGQLREVALVIDVGDFEIPDECGCVADMNNYGIGITRGFTGLDPESDRYLNIERSFFRMAHDHRSLFHLLPYTHAGRIESESFAPRLSGHGRNRHVSDWTAYDRHWGPYLDGSAFAGTRRGAIPIPYMYMPFNLNWPASFVKWGTEGWKVEFQNVLRDFARHFAERGWTKTKLEIFGNHKTRWLYFPWDMDEIRFEKDNAATLFFSRISKEAVSDIRGPQFVFRIDSSWIFGDSAKGSLGDAVDLWIVMGGFHAPFPDESDMLRKKGATIFFYGGSPGIDGRHATALQFGWSAWGRKVDGFTWWNTIGWGAGPKSLTEPGQYQSQNLWYPGEPVGIEGAVPNVMTKLALRAQQDFEYLALAEKKRGREAVGAVTQRHLNTAAEQWMATGKAKGVYPHKLSGTDADAPMKFQKPWLEVKNASWTEARRELHGMLK